MSEPKKIIHLSDLHVGYPGLGERLNDLVSRLIFLKEPAERYIVIISGDLTDDATAADAYDGPRRAVDRLRKAGYPVLLCPGNHDYGTGVLASKRYIQAFKESFFDDASFTWPRLDVINEIALIGLDTMAEEVNWYDRLFAQGELGRAQLDRLEALLSDTRIANATRKVVYLHHHPFDHRPFHGLKDSDDLGQLLRGRGIDALLYGHNHEGRIAHGKWGIPRCYDAGTATYKPGIPPRGVGFHRVMDLSQSPQTDYDGQFLPAGLQNVPVAMTMSNVANAALTETAAHGASAALHAAGALQAAARGE